MKLIFATHNTHKTEEVIKMLPDFIKIQSLKDIGYTQEIIEDGKTFEENAKIKAETIYNHNHTKLNVFADDSGLVIPSLNNEPGIYSARYAGTGNSEDNIHKVLKKLGDNINREAYFICCICCIIQGKEYFFTGKVEGIITKKLNGKKGFGYDPIFQPSGHDITLAEMESHQKNQISHRAIAMKKLNDFLVKIHK